MISENLRRNREKGRESWGVGIYARFTQSPEFLSRANINLMYTSESEMVRKRRDT